MHKRNITCKQCTGDCKNSGEKGSGGRESGSQKCLVKIHEIYKKAGRYLVSVLECQMLSRF